MMVTNYITLSLVIMSINRKYTITIKIKTKENVIEIEKVNYLPLVSH